MKHVHSSPIMFVKLVILAGKNEKRSNTRVVKSQIDSGASEYILAKAKADKFPA